MGIQGAGGSCNNEKSNKMIQTIQHASATTANKHLYHTKETIPGVNKTGGRISGFHDCTSQIRHHRDLTNFCTVGSNHFLYG